MEFAEFISVHQVDNVILTDKTDENRKGFSLEGTLCITGHHIILSSRQEDHQELWVGIQCFHFCIVCFAYHSKYYIN